MSDRTKLPIDLIERAREMEDRLLEFIGNQHRRAVANILVCGENYCACRQRANMKEISRAREATGGWNSFALKTPPASSFWTSTTSSSATVARRLEDSGPTDVLECLKANMPL